MMATSGMFLFYVMQTHSMAPDSKKISVILDMAIIRQIADHNMTQTEAVTRGLKALFSEDYQKMESYKEQIISDEKKILVLEARLAEFELIKNELERSHDLIEKQREDYHGHVVQVQTLINQRDMLGRLEEKRKKRWWWFW
jgi:hypothetical protein